MQINIWELGSRINVKVTEELLKQINNRIKQKYSTKQKAHAELTKSYQVPFSTFRTRLKKGYTYFVDLEILLTLCDLLGLPKQELQNNIIALKTRRGHNYIQNPILPVTITPLFDMLVAHHIFDGNVVNPKHGRKPYFSYRQFNREYRDLYIRKIEKVFGTLRYKTDYLTDPSTTKVNFPVVGSEIMFSYYGLNVNSYKSNNARIPQPIIDGDWKHRLAVLLAAIIDEGHVDSTLINIRVKNKGLIEDLRLICDSLEYENSLKTGKDGLFSLYILSGSICKFYQDYLALFGEYPEVNLGFKGKKIEEYIRLREKPRRYVPGNRDRLLNILRAEQLSTNELSQRLHMTRQGTRYLMKGLIKQNIIEAKKTTKFGNKVYGIR